MGKDRGSWLDGEPGRTSRRGLSAGRGCEANRGATPRNAALGARPHRRRVSAEHRGARISRGLRRTARRSRAHRRVHDAPGSARGRLHVPRLPPVRHLVDQPALRRAGAGHRVRGRAGEYGVDRRLVVLGAALAGWLAWSPRGLGSSRWWLRLRSPLAPGSWSYARVQPTGATPSQQIPRRCHPVSSTSLRPPAMCPQPARRRHGIDWRW